MTFHEYVFQGNSYDPRLGVRSLPTRLSIRLRYVNSCVTKNRSDLTCNSNIPYVVSGDLTIPGLSDLMTNSSPTFLNTSLSRKKKHSFLYVGNSQNSYFGRGLSLFQLLVTFTLQCMFFYIDVRDSKVSFNKRNLFESSLLMGRLSKIQEFLVYGEIIEVRQNFL